MLEEKRSKFSATGSSSLLYSSRENPEFLQWTDIYLGYRIAETTTMLDSKTNFSQNLFLAGKFNVCGLFSVLLASVAADSFLTECCQILLPILSKFEWIKFYSPWNHQKIMIEPLRFCWTLLWKNQVLKEDRMWHKK